MTTHQMHTPRPAQESAPSLPLAMLGLFVGCVLIALATWLGITLRDEPVGTPALQPGGALKLVDADRALVFDATTGNGDIRILNVRSGVSEIARLHEAGRGDVTAISLDVRRSVLTVESAIGRHEYDTRTFRLLTSTPVLAAGPAP